MPPPEGRAHVPGQLRHRGRRGSAQAGPPPHRAAQRDRLLRRLPRPLARQPVAHREQGPPARRLRHPDAGQLPRPVLEPLRRGRARPGPTTSSRCCSSGSPSRTTSPRSSSSRSRARAATSCRPRGWLADLRALCDRHGILLVVDEVQSGIGRTGTMWACEHDGSVDRRARHHVHRQGPGERAATGGIVARADDHGLGTRRPRLDVRRQPGRVRGGPSPRSTSSSGELAANAATVGGHLLAALRALQRSQPMHRSRCAGVD